jgi:Putative peptidoglycan binding domain
MVCSRIHQRALPWMVRASLVAFWLMGAGAAMAQDPEAEQNYKRFLAVYRQDNPTAAELEKALNFLETANRLAPNAYKYVYSLGALNSSLARWEVASRWLEKAKTLAVTGEQKAQVQMELDYCQTQIAKARVKSWGGPGVSISFIMKEGTVEMGQSIVERLPQRLPVVRVGEATQPLEDALRRALGGMSVRMAAKDLFLIAGLQDDTLPETHYERGIKDFYNYFKSQYFERPPERQVVVVLSSAPYPLVEATRRLYPEVGIPVYAPFLGYYNPSDNLIMATGGSAGYGTLLHEMIHALIKADFPNVPPWLNEGLASLYERTQWSAARLNALPNWRMDQMREDGLRSLRELGRTAKDIGLHSNQIGEIRLFLLFLDQRHQVNVLYRMAKQKGSAFSLEDGIRELGLQEQDWRTFARNVFRDYKAEMAGMQATPTNPDDVRFIQLALNRILGASLNVDGLWGASTEDKLVEFQKRYSLQPDGMPGPKTWTELRRQYTLGQMKAMQPAP